MKEKEISPQKKMTITAQLLYARAGIVGAPDYVTDALRAWARELEHEGEGEGEGFAESVGVMDRADIELTNVKGVKSDA